MAIECEAKIKVHDPASLQARLKDLGAEDKGTVLEKNWVLDDKAGSLVEKRILLRVRNNGGSGGMLTVKGDAPGGAFKTREEVETGTDSTERLLRQLEFVGFRVAWIYEKRRQTWTYRDCAVTLDHLPEMGDYIEVEGAGENITAVLRDLGLDPTEHIDGNYLTLWQKHLAARGETGRHMLFADPDAGNDKEKNA